ncbi:MAG: E3 binding domain-containing protein, partial [Gemmatimonadota bacterium]
EQAPERAVTTEKAPEPPESGSAAPAEITEAARQLAEGHGIDLSTIEGSGKGGRILKGDVERAIKEREGS